MNLKGLISKIEEKFMNLYWIKGIIIIFLIPFFFIVPLIIIIALAKINRALIHLNFNIHKQDYIYYYIYFMTLIVNGCLSFMLYKVTRRSNIIAEDNNKLGKQTLELQHAMIENEIRLKKSKVKENALIIYYELHFGLENVFEVYKFHVLKHGSNKTDKCMYFSDNWSSRVSMLSNDIEIKDIYEMYGYLLRLNKYFYNLNYAEINRDTFSGNMTKELEEFFNIFFIDNKSLGEDELTNYNKCLKERYKTVMKNINNLAKDEV